MYIIDDETEKALNEVTILLTQKEAKELLGYVKQLFNGDPLEHFHIPSENYKKEITICLYDSNNIQHFSDSIQKIIKDSKNSE